jgi:serine/threonine protein kinase/tetratricopeptide (TPR) repeat protein
MEQIGEGGMGLVFVAEQQEPIRRKVALKIIKPGMDTRQVVARFEAERQALALMDHPNIAKVLDGGTTESSRSRETSETGGTLTSSATGRPYFVMELVKGVPITEYCDQNQVPVRERLELFVDVCEAVQHAHQKGIIHRDIKPSNVLVTLHDGKPVVKVIDFGVAKAIGQQLTDKTVYTHFAQLIGTPLYMSPEQAGESSLDIDTRSDIYSLGVLLYELLTGTTPFDKDRLSQVGYDEMRRIIREEEPPKPSTRISTLGQAASTASANRKSDPRKLSHLFRGELDWIVMKALEKDRNRRYETANGFAMDVQRYLAHEPVLAGPPSAAYRLRKFVRRNRGAVLAALTILLLLVGGIVGTSIGLVGAREAAEQERRAKELAETRGNALASIFTGLDPRTEGKNRPPLRVLLADYVWNAAQQVVDESGGDALDVARFQNLLGNALCHLDQGEKAVILQQKALQTRAARLGPDHPDTLASKDDLAYAYLHAGKVDQAALLWEEVLPKKKEVLGPEHPDTVQCLNNLAGAYNARGQHDLARPLLEEALVIRRRTQGEEHPSTLGAMNNLAALYYAQRQFDKAEPLFIKSLVGRRRVVGEENIETLSVTINLAALYHDLGDEHSLTLNAMSGLAAVYHAQRQFDKAEQLFVKALEVSRRVKGEEHPVTLTALSWLAGLYQTQGRLDKAEQLFVKALEVSRRVKGEEDPATLTCLINLGALHQAQRQFARAEPLYLQALETRRRVLGEEHPDTITAMNNLASLYKDQGRLDKALPLYVQTVELSRRVKGAEHPHTLTSMGGLATIYQMQRQFARAEPLFVKALEGRRQALGEEHPDTITDMNNLALLYLLRGRLDKAEPLYVRTVELSRRVKGEEDPHTLSSMRDLAALYQMQRQFDKAEPLWVMTLEITRRVKGEENLETLIDMDKLAGLYWARRQYGKAEPLLVKALEISRRILPEDHEDLPTTMNSLALLYEVQHQYPKAEPLRRESLEKLRKRYGASSTMAAYSYDIARSAHESEAYQKALQALGSGAARDFRIVESPPSVTSMSLPSMPSKKHTGPLTW